MTRQQKTILYEVTENIEETLAFGKKIATIVQSTPYINCIALVGDLGSGKTTLAKGIIHTIAGVPYEEVFSPTFQYVSLFTTSSGRDISHCDVWRIESVEKFEQLGLMDLFKTSFCIVEWADRIASLLPQTTLTVNITRKQENQRIYNCTLGPPHIL